MTDLALNSTLHGFTVTSHEDLAEIEGSAWVMHHEASGARLLFLQNDDENKAFSIAFKTPPGNDTGVFHILEHSVLCGSDKFPVKEPFVNLLKSSMQTFLNAMTFPDKTMYPVASTNEQDLLNLMDVYMDAVFHPAIYRKEEIFRQEGWHYELAGTPEQPQLVYNGVVFNEMKGALSSSQGVLFDVLQESLFPDTAYRFESGGTPEGIVDLTYEAFLDEHRAHYRTDNSSIVLYGDMNIDRVLAFLDERYLAPLAACTASGNSAAHVANVLEPRALLLQEPVVAEGIVRKMETAPENACCALGYVVGTAADREKIYAADILLDALLGSNEAPLKRALLDADLGDDIGETLADSMLQPFAVITLKGAQPNVLARFKQTAEDAMRAILAKGIDPKLIEASLAHTEFVLREADFGISDGVALAISSLSGWLYDEDDSLATAYIRYEDVLADLRKKIGTSYFDDLAREIFLDCPHRASVEIKPIEAASPSAEELQLAHVLEEMDEADLTAIAEQVERLRTAQEQPDSPEAIATLPRLDVRDIGPAKVRPGYHLVDRIGIPCVHHEVNTRGLAYARRFYDACSFSFEDVPYLSILTMLLGKLDTARHTAAEIDTLVQTRLGDLSFYKEVHSLDCDATPRSTSCSSSRSSCCSSSDDVQLVVVASASSLEENVQDLCDIPAEIMYETDYSDTAKIKSILQQTRFSIEQHFASSGHTAARSRASSYYLHSAVLAEALGGVDFYYFLKDLLVHYEERAESLSAKLHEMSKRLFTHNGLILSFAGSEGALGAYLTAIDSESVQQVHDAACANADATDANMPDRDRMLTIPDPVHRNEAFAVPCDVTYTGQTYSLGLMEGHAGVPFDSAWNVVSRALSFDYLWSEVRVKGGAYGVGFNAARTGRLSFYSYRDPNIDATVERFAEAATWIESFDPSEDEMSGYIVSTVAGFDAPVKPRALSHAQMADFFTKRDPDWRIKARERVLAVTPEMIRQFAAPIREAQAHNMICVFGNKEIIEKSALDFQVVDLLNE